MGEQPKKDKTLSWLVIVICVFILRTFAWMTSELWYDEVLTLQRFVLPHIEHPLEIFRDYPIANNHLLFTWLACLWTNLLDGFFSELFLRLPSLLFGIASIAVVMLHWHRHLGNLWAGICGILLAISPVYTAYAYQLRGYSLTILLGITAISGLLELLEKRTAAGQALLCISGFLLPLVIPTNLMLMPAMAATGVLLLKEKENNNWKTAILSMLPWCVACVVGGSYYLTIWEQFRRATAEPDGWTSMVQVAGNLLLALFAHGAVLIVCMVTHVREGRIISKGLWLSWAALAATALAVMLAGKSGHTPFPRVFLVLLPLATFLLMKCAAAMPSMEKVNASILVAAILVNGIVWERVAEGLTDYQLKHGYFPDNLLQQYYRGSSDLRDISEAKNLDLANALVILEPYDEMSGAFYIRLMGRPDAQGIAIGINTVNDNIREQLAKMPLRKFAVTRSAEEAKDLFKRAGFEMPGGKMPRKLFGTNSSRRALFEFDD